MWKEDDHPRGQPENKGQFVEKHEKDKRGYNSQSDLNNLPSVWQGVKLSKQEYGVLRQEVMRKNSAQKGKVKPNNFAFTSNNFYIYQTSGNDNFVIMKQYDIEKDRDKINEWLELWGEGI